MPYSSQPDLGPTINVELEPDIGDATEASMTANFDVRYVNAGQDGPSYRYLVTLINIKTGAEEMLDILISRDSF